MVKMTALNKKLLRDILHLRGQVLAIAFVIGSGVATLVMSLSTVEALQKTADLYYQQYKFADVFAFAKRAPERLTLQIAKIPGVQTLETRITRIVSIDIKNFKEPVIGQVMSVPKDRQPLLNQLVMRKGRWVSGERDDEIILSEPFAEAHSLKLGDQIDLLMNGRKRSFNVVGLALSPEFIYSIGPGSLMPDDKRFGVMWMSRDILEGVYDLKESFNSITLKLMHNTPTAPLLNELDLLLESYGGVSAIMREDQISNWFVQNEIAQQKTMAKILPGIFILVSVFLTNMVLSRLIATERTEIGLLKAFGYNSAEIGWHYTKLILLICLIGVLFGFLLGSVFGRMNTQNYADLFRFPIFIYQPGALPFVLSALISTSAALVGGLGAVKKAITLSPAEAMIPPSPDTYKNAASFSSSWTNWLDQPTRIAIRQIGKWPLRSFFTSIGIAFSVGLIVMNLQWTDSLAHLSRVYFFEAQRQDITLGLSEPIEMRGIHDIENLPGVMKAEPVRIISADFKHGTATHRGAIFGILEDSQLQPIYDDKTRSIRAVPKAGLMMSTRLATKLKLSVGDEVWIEILEGKRPKVSIPIMGVFETFIGTPVFMELTALNRLLKEPPSFKFINLLMDENKYNDAFETLKDMPQISAVMMRQSALDSFNNSIIEHLLVFIHMFVSLAALLAFGVTYNSTRIALSERARELATLRVLGFSKGEISYILLGEVMFLVLFALPVGCVIGRLLVLSMATAFDTEMFRVPLIIENSTYGYAVTIIIGSAIISALIVRQRVDKLDLIKVLKTRE